MATITKKQLRDRQFGGPGPAYGNATQLRFKLVTGSSGQVTDSDSSSAVASGDVVKIGVLPAGFTLHDSLITVVTAWTASVTGKIGFAYVDGTDVTAVPQDDDYFGTGVAINTAGVYRKATATGPVTLPKDAWLILTTAAANNAKASETHFVISGELGGPP